MKGKITVSYDVHCAGCDRPVVELGTTKIQAERRLKYFKWRLKAGKWICDTCSLVERIK